ncbi:MAG: acyl-[acyl-carrier-protein]-phospholipid O-acyltransferase [Sulfurimonas sp.]|jgi:acyl-[acyl-carrier-protein]-phospholipid O-acyltransferase/long-chain-fatty-acid--[acyl-carrier-protein] ligase
MRDMFKIVGVVNYLIVVFLNAFTDLGHKIIIQNTIFKIYDGDMQIVLTAIVNALIILPFILVFSPTGFLSDRFPKNEIMKYSALFAVFITLGITYCYYNGYFYTAFAFTFLLAFQSAIYGPAKYGYIKEIVGIKFISGGNGAVQAVTTVAILGGMIFYTILFEGMLDDSFTTKEDILQLIAPAGWLLVLGSIIQFTLALKLPNKMQQESQKKFSLKKYFKGEYLHKNIKIIKRKREVFENIIALGLFWSISQVILAVFGEFAKSELNVSNTIYIQGVMALAGIGIVSGSIFAANLSKYYIKTGLVAIGTFAITIIVFLIPLSTSMTTMAILFALFGFFAGFIMVPLNAQIQFISPRVHLGTILAGNNFIQNIFMFSFLILTTIFAYFGMNATILIYAMGVVGILLTYLVLKRYFVMTFWAFLELILKPKYKFNYVGLENIPSSGGVLLLGNHVSWIDWIVLQIPIQRRINFMIDKEIYNWKFSNKIFKKGEVIPVSPKASKDAFAQASVRLKHGKIVALFPEGQISTDGKTGNFYRGYELISSDYDGKIITFFIDGMNGSLFSKTRKLNLFRQRKVTVYFSKPISKETKAEELREIVISLKDKYEIK